jgi:two-component system, NarL family, sensor histidine kinase UhpB
MDSAPTVVDAGGVRATVDHPVPARGRRTPASALFWRLFLLNGAVLVAGVGALALSPATVSEPVLAPELTVLVVGLAVMLTANAVLLRSALRPLDGLSALMERVDLLRPGERLAVRGDPDVAHLLRTFNEMLDRLEGERVASGAEQLAAQEAERQRIARELHDEIGQGLTAVLLGLKRVVDGAPEELREDLCGVQELVRATLDEVRQVARRLRPGVLDDLGLQSALHALAADTARAGRLTVERAIDPPPATLPGAAELVVYRVAQEALTNVVRHAHATRVELALTTAPGRVVLRVTDDGRGPAGTVEGTGIRGMRERALLIAAELTVAPARPCGTDVRLVVPVPEPS